MRNNIGVELETFINFIIESLDDEQMVHLIEEYDEAVANWDFVHKGYMAFRKIIQNNKLEYKEYLEDMVILQEHSIIEIMDDLEEE